MRLQLIHFNILTDPHHDGILTALCRYVLYIAMRNIEIKTSTPYKPSAKIFERRASSPDTPSALYMIIIITAVTTSRYDNMRKNEYEIFFS